jgi:hypothetical protein
LSLIMLAQPALRIPFHDRVQELPPTVSAGDVALAEHRAFTVAELVEAEQGVIADAPVVAVVLGALLLAMHRVLRTVQVQDQTPGLRMGHGRRHPGGVQRGQPFPVALGREDRGLRASHRVTRCRLLATRPAAHYQAQGWVPGQAIGIIGVGVTRQATIDRLAEQRHQVVLDAASRPLLPQELTHHRRQPQLPIQLAVRHHPGVGSDLATHELQPHPSVELQAQRLLLAFTHWVPPAITAAMPAAARLPSVSCRPHCPPPPLIWTVRVDKPRFPTRSLTITGVPWYTVSALYGRPKQPKSL